MHKLRMHFELIIKLKFLAAVITFENLSFHLIVMYGQLDKNRCYSVKTIDFTYIRGRCVCKRIETAQWPFCHLLHTHRYKGSLGCSGKSELPLYDVYKLCPLSKERAQKDAILQSFVIEAKLQLKLWLVIFHTNYLIQKKQPLLATKGIRPCVRS